MRCFFTKTSSLRSQRAAISACIGRFALCFGSLHRVFDTVASAFPPRSYALGEDISDCVDTRSPPQPPFSATHKSFSSTANSAQACTAAFPCCTTSPRASPPWPHPAATGAVCSAHRTAHARTGDIAPRDPNSISQLASQCGALSGEEMRSDTRVYVEHSTVPIGTVYSKSCR